MAELSEDARHLLEEPNLASFVTLMKDGTPHVTPTWVDHDGTHVLINTVVGHQKALNVERNKHVAVMVMDRSNGGRYVQVRGRVVEIIGGQVAFDSIEKLSQKYRGASYPRREGEERLMLKILPEHITGQGGGRGRGGSRWGQAS
ncbi:MAG: TIGR03618 family F420-dependent PPOX class oxidoreductase [Dehalococcoidia bacterium]|nr:TIGR03618 family F420-dependent PPOX class oxidoreductase [Dehalococcoidia bacterium]